ncbi:kinase-like protein [Dendrothele bispora CBS 962.96]|uniref:Kinase-like protein n=1 Tax=Dendrothele bispora (strain CBS 962.96) TaxID=1314807 RepID=A0A4S8L769_DENBC|nr:kinase-like protein [Dendrothele bispora CBS 962.96]
MCEKERLRSKIFEAMVHISRNSNLYPTCLSLSNVEKVGDDPIAGGSFGDIWRASVGGQTACMKVGFLKEAILWRQLQHPNVLPFLGLYFLDDSRKRICLLSPMMENGNLNSYLDKHSEKEAHRITLAYDVSCGLSYLHKMKIVHGDLKGVCLCSGTTKVLSLLTFLVVAGQRPYNDSRKSRYSGFWIVSCS